MPFERVRILLRFVAQPTADMIGNDNTMVLTKRLHQVAPVKRPGRIAMYHYHRLKGTSPGAFVEVMVAQVIKLQVVRAEGILTPPIGRRIIHVANISVVRNSR